MEIVVKFLFASFLRILFRRSWTLFETLAAFSTPERSLEWASTIGNFKLFQINNRVSKLSVNCSGEIFNFNRLLALAMKAEIYR